MPEKVKFKKREEFEALLEQSAVPISVILQKYYTNTQDEVVLNDLTEFLNNEEPLRQKLIKNTVSATEAMFLRNLHMQTSDEFIDDYKNYLGDLQTEFKKYNQKIVSMKLQCFAQDILHCSGNLTRCQFSERDIDMMIEQYPWPKMNFTEKSKNSFKISTKDKPSSVSDPLQPQMMKDSPDETNTDAASKPCKEGERSYETRHGLSKPSDSDSVRKICLILLLAVKREKFGAKLETIKKILASLQEKGFETLSSTDHSSQLGEDKKESEFETNSDGAQKPCTEALTKGGRDGTISHSAQKSRTEHIGENCDRIMHDVPSKPCTGMQEKEDTKCVSSSKPCTEASEEKSSDKVSSFREEKTRGLGIKSGAISGSPQSRLEIEENACEAVVDANSDSCAEVERDESGDEIIIDDTLNSDEDLESPIITRSDERKKIAGLIEENMRNKATRVEAIDSEGGEISLYGCSVQFPKDAIKEKTEFTLEVDNNPKNFPSSVSLITPVMGLKPHVKFEKKVTVTMRTCYSATEGGEIPGQIWSQEEDGDWKFSKKTLLKFKNQVSFKIDHFSNRAAAVTTEESETGEYHFLNDVYIHQSSATIISLFSLSAKTQEDCRVSLSKSNYLQILPLAEQIKCLYGSTIIATVECKTPSQAEYKGDPDDPAKFEVTKTLLQKQREWLDISAEESFPADFRGNFKAYYRVKNERNELLIKARPLNQYWPFEKKDEGIRIHNVQQTSVQKDIEAQNVLAPGAQQKHSTSDPNFPSASRQSTVQNAGVQSNVTGTNVLAAGAQQKLDINDSIFTASSQRK